MALFAWSEKYSVNIREIDAQHKKLIGMVGQLNDAMRQGKGKQALGEVLRNLIEYTRTHFAAEERLMKTHGYPEYESHKTKHESMTRKVADIYREYQDGKATITLEVMNFLESWLDKHIMGTDMQYGPFLNGKGLS
jgi:hemerythrin